MTITDDPTPTTMQPVRLSDYRPPAWRIDRVELVFDLDLTDTEVGARLHLSPDPDQPGQSLRLDGEDLDLLAITLDGELLPATRYTQDATGLTVHDVASACLLETRVRVHPERNTRLEGLYASRGLLITQYEAEGFRRITFFVDRPDVSSCFAVPAVAARATRRGCGFNRCSAATSRPGTSLLQRFRVAA